MPYPAALLLTLAIELPIYVALLTPRPRWPRAIALALAVNVITHPFVWLILDRADDRYWVLFAPVEIGAVVVEAVLLVAWSRHPPARVVVPVATLANAASCAVGLLAMAA